MKKISMFLALIFILSVAVSVCSCSSTMIDSAMPGMGGAFKGESAEGGSDDGGEGGESNEPVYLPAGMITAGAWNDNDNYSMWIPLFEQAENEEDKNGKFFEYSNSEKSWGFNSLNRIKVHVTCGESAVAGASVIAYSNDNKRIFSAVSDAQGNAYIFVNDEEGTIYVNSGTSSVTKTFSSDERELEVELKSFEEKKNVIEIMFVVDVTGSMGDEIRYLKAEIADVISKISKADPETVINLAFLFYRDNRDTVPFKYYDFENVTTEAGMKKQQNAISSQSASGGGDYPEAVDQALEMAMSKQWSDGNTTKLIFHVLDAPAHEGSKYEEKFNKAVMTAAEKGIRICPIICSGAAELTEYTMRQAAIYTGGTFIFVTDDSGIGNSHHDPELPNVTVELLNSMLVRLVKGYHTGVFEDPIYWKEDENLAK